MTVKKKGLKKGTLEFLLSSTGLDEADVLESREDELSTSRDDYKYSSETSTGLLNLAIEKIQRSPYQPRKHFAPESLQELAESIKSKGLIQPIVVRRNADYYELIAGERRWRAAQMAGLHNIPAIVKDVDDETALVMAVVENIQREDLNPIEEARGLQRLVDEFGMTQQQISEVVGKSRVTVTNLLRLLGLSPQVQKMVELGELEMGHARALLTLTSEQQVFLAQKIMAKGASVRETELWVREAQQDKVARENTSSSFINDPNIKSLQVSLAESLGARVTINHEKTGKGKLIINYHSLDELDGIIAKIS
ncbi:MAG: ParB/RepB/Spo0J family partition protein [Gammaproteobacteria bacterium]|nr:ParB/RepB/Spo0J family partition protein [Gammaproteobacteria bacterium]